MTWVCGVLKLTTFFLLWSDTLMAQLEADTGLYLWMQPTLLPQAQDTGTRLKGLGQPVAHSTSIQLSMLPVPQIVCSLKPTSLPWCQAAIKH